MSASRSDVPKVLQKEIEQIGIDAQCSTRILNGSSPNGILHMNVRPAQIYTMNDVICEQQLSTNVY